MGLFTKLKNAITGGAARVEIETESFGDVGALHKVTVTVASTGGEVRSDGVFVDVEGIETIKVREDSPGQKEYGAENVTSSTSAAIAGPFVLGAGETRTFEGEFEIPSGKPPTCRGTFVRHEWRVRGRLAAPGVDPTSAWRSIPVMCTEYGRAYQEECAARERAAAARR